MQEFQKLVQESLKHAGYYCYHPTDFNIAHSNAHIFTVPKDCDYICGCPHTGKIFWIEAKDTKGKKFHPMHGASNARQFNRAILIDEVFHTFYYVVNFSELNIVAYFNPLLIRDSGSFDPLQYDGLRITRLSRVTENVFGQQATRSLLDMTFLTEILALPVET